MLRILLVTVLLFVLNAFPVQAADPATEIFGLIPGGYNAVVTPGFYTANPKRGSLFNATGIVYNGYHYLYVQGGIWGTPNTFVDQNGNPMNCFQNDAIFAFRAPIFPVENLFLEYEPRLPVTPCPPPDTTSYGPGSAVYIRGEIYLFYDESDGNDFKKLRWSSSKNAENFNRQDQLLVATHPSVEILAPVLVTGSSRLECDPNGNCSYHTTVWGYMPFMVNDGQVRTAKVKFDHSSSWPRKFQPYIWYRDQWVAVDNVSMKFDFVPDNVWNGVQVKSMVYNNSRWELWGKKGSSLSGCHSCDPDWQPKGGGSRLVYRVVDQVTHSFTVGPFNVNSKVRCQPSDEPVFFPYRVNLAGYKWLFTSMNPAICTLLATSPYNGMGTVVTQVSY